MTRTHDRELLAPALTDYGGYTLSRMEENYQSA